MLKTTGKLRWRATAGTVESQSGSNHYVIVPKKHYVNIYRNGRLQQASSVEAAQKMCERHATGKDYLLFAD